ncbi:MAG: hypothetical protein EZS28_007354 [Streblomastix strix]|uniref:Uncharacterized protein n=1 Tax=Streblomastix strix TaxID=222440 RepID=A0A5J4WPQ8_9EUKA|nr:MAG: hypothetical protein EZS28_007354 [Streblomastix strix]
MPTLRKSISCKIVTVKVPIYLITNTINMSYLESNMQHLEFCPGKHLSWDISKCDELRNLPEFVAQLTSEDSTKRLEALEKIFDAILAVQIEYCRAEQFSGLLDGLQPLLVDIQSKEAEKAVQIIELLWAKQFNTIQSEREKLFGLFKEKQLRRLMKKAFLNYSTPAPIKESLALQIFLWNCIENAEDSCFIPILDLIQSKLKVEEEYLLKHPNGLNHESKWSKIGLQNLEVYLTAFCYYSSDSDEFAKEIAKRDGINIGLRYLKHPLVQIREPASNLFGIAMHQTIGLEFRKNNDCLAILNEIIRNPTFKLVSYENSINISPVKHLPHLHSGILNESGLCLNCDLQHSSNSTNDNIDKEYKFIYNQLISIRDLIKNVDAVLGRLNEFIEEEEKEKAQKILENEESDVEVECEECGQMIPFGRFLLHMKSHNALEDVHYEINKENKKDDKVENDNTISYLKCFHEDIEEEGLFETIQSLNFQDYYYGRNVANTFHKKVLNHLTQD